RVSLNDAAGKLALHYGPTFEDRGGRLRVVVRKNVNLRRRDVAIELCARAELPGGRSEHVHAETRRRRWLSFRWQSTGSPESAASKVEREVARWLEPEHSPK